MNSDCAEAFAENDRLRASNAELLSLLDEATIMLEVLVKNNPEKQIPYGDFARKFRAAIAKAEGGLVGRGAKHRRTMAAYPNWRPE